MPETLKLNSLLWKKLDAELAVLETEKSTDFRTMLEMRISNVNNLKKPENRAIFENESSDEVYELLLAVMGYDRTTFKILKVGLSEKSLEFLYSIKDSTKLFYQLIYDREITLTSVQKLREVRQNLTCDDLSRIQIMAQNLNCNENKIIQNYAKNKQIIQQKSEKIDKLNERDQRFIEDLAYIVNSKIRKFFEKIIDEIDKLAFSNLQVLSRSIAEFVKGKISFEEFEKIFSHRKSDNMMLAYKQAVK